MKEMNVKYPAYNFIKYDNDSSPQKSTLSLIPSSGTFTQAQKLFTKSGVVPSTTPTNSKVRIISSPLLAKATILRNNSIKKQSQLDPSPSSRGSSIKIIPSSPRKISFSRILASPLARKSSGLRQRETNTSIPPPFQARQEPTPEQQSQVQATRKESTGMDSKSNLMS